MGEDFTDAEGRYRIGYAGGEWDMASGGNWRPDIYVEADLEYDGEWHTVHKSIVFWNVLHVVGLVYDAEAFFTEPEPDTATTPVIGTLWAIRNCNPSLWVRVRFNRRRNWSELLPGDTMRVFVPDGESRTFTSETQVSLVWLYPETHTISGVSPGINNDEYCIGGGR